MPRQAFRVLSAIRLKAAAMMMVRHRASVFSGRSGRLRPRHGAEILLGRFVTVVVSSRFEQAVREYDVCITKEGRRAVFASCDVPQFVFVRLLGKRGVTGRWLPVSS